MKSKNEIINDYKVKIKSLKKHNKLYFTDDNPKISDSDYDNLKKETLELESKFPYLKNLPNLRRDIVGAPVSNKSTIPIKIITGHKMHNPMTAKEKSKTRKICKFSHSS